MLELHLASQRGETQTESLTSKHSFSHGEYLNHTRMGWSVLQTLNDNFVKPGSGFAESSHENMEILTYVIKGTLVHTDSLGNEQKVPKGAFQLMTSGTGISHTESNGSTDAELEFIEMWIIPNQVNIRPGYQQRMIERSSNFQLVASHMPREDAMFLNQDGEVYRFNLDINRYFYLSRAADSHKAYVQVVKGELELCDGSDTLCIKAGDGVMCSDIERLEFIKSTDEVAEGLLFVLPGIY